MSEGFDSVRRHASALAPAPGRTTRAGPSRLAVCSAAGIDTARPRMNSTVHEHMGWQITPLCLSRERVT